MIVVKEVKEESGFIVSPVRLLALLDKNKHNHPPSPYHVYKLFILCEITGGEAVQGMETSEVEFFAKDQLPNLSEGRNTYEQINMMFDLVERGEQATVID